MASLAVTVTVTMETLVWKSAAAAESIVARTHKTLSLYHRASISSSDHDEGNLLHGMLQIKIVRCKNLRNKDGMRGIHGKLPVPKFLDRDVSDPYVIVSAVSNNDYCQTRLAKTRVIDNNLNPEWNEVFYLNVCHYVTELEFKVNDKDLTSSEILGIHILPVGRLLATDEETGQHQRVALHRVVDLDDKPKHGSLEYFVEYIPKAVLLDQLEVPGTYFKMHEGNSVKLYVNADDGAPGLPEVRYGGPRDDEKVWNPQRLWRDIYDAICGARHFIYITGWAVDSTQSLLRGKEKDEVLKDEKAYTPYIGALLAQKADEGVAVNMLVW